MKILTEMAQNPKRCLTSIIQENKFSYACWGYGIGIISLYFAIKLGRQESASLISFFFVFIIWVITNILLNLVLAAICNMLLELTEKKISALGIFILLGLSQIIWSLLIPCFMILQAFPQTILLTPLIVLGIIALQIYFVLNSIKQVYGISRASSLLAFIFSFILPLAAVFCFGIFTIGLLTALFA